MQWPTMDSGVKSRFWKRIHKIKNFQRPKNHVKIWVFDLRFDTPKNRQLCTHYARLFRNFQESRKKCKKVPKSADFGTYLVEISGIEPLTS